MGATKRQRLRFGAYELRELVGIGGMARIWRAAKPGHPDVALKLLHVDADKASQQRLRHEAQVLAALDGEHVVRIHEVVEHEGRLGLAMEMCLGSLEDWVKQRGPLPERSVIEVALQAVDGLLCASRMGLLHRDIKPGNLLIAADGRVKVGDFGIAAFLLESGTRSESTALWGTLPFVAPERRHGQPIDTRSDIYSLAVTMVWLATSELHGDVHMPSVQDRLRRCLSPSLLDIVIRAGAYEPGCRFADLIELREALLRAAEGLERRPRVELSAFTRAPLLETVALERSSPGASTRGLSKRLMMLGLVALGVVSVTVALALRLSAVDSEAVPAPSSLPTASTSSSAPLELPPCPDVLNETRNITVVGPRETMDASAADLDGDGWHDLFFVNQLDETLSIYWGSRVASLKNPTQLVIGRAERRPAVADIDRDGHVDLVLAHLDTSTISIHRGLGGRQFAPPQTLSQAPPPRNVALLDWDLDGELDLLLTLRFEDACTAWRKGLGGGRYERHQCIGPASTLDAPFGSKPVAVYTREGDVLMRHEPRSNTTLGAGRAIGGGALQSLGRVVAVRDSDGDGVDEVYAALNVLSEHRLVRITAAGACIVARNFDVPLESVSDIIDVDADGLLDLVGRRTCSGCTSNHTVALGIAASAQDRR